ncbi:glycosyltransferase family 87 protein [Leifsonia aquatica]|uniref:glycosyltransferase family 87 protein n=1 Tax=Leifsonia aquatica TaxID=144185 RepID=UPI00384B0547
MRIAVTAVLLAASAVVMGVTATAFGMVDNRGDDRVFIACTVALWILFAAAIIVFRGVRGRAAVALILAGGLAIGGAALAGPPNTSTDSARYVWDGLVQNAGISPYAYVPDADALAEVRTPWLFPSEAGIDPSQCTLPRLRQATSSPSGMPLCTAINRPSSPTIYPPTAELFFGAVTLVSGSSAHYLPLQIAGLLMSLGITVLLMRALLRRRMDVRWAALWAWSPFVATEGVNNSHIDMLATLLVLVATLAVSRGFRFRSGIALGAAIATKLVPIIAAPALLRKQPWKVATAAVATFSVLYIPYVLSTGIAVLGYLPGYLTEEGYSSGTRFTILASVLPPTWTLAVAAVLLAITAALVWWKTDPERPWLGQLVMIGTTLLVVSPNYPWYALMLVPFIALTRRWEWFAVPAAMTLRQLYPHTQTYLGMLWLATLLIVIVSIRRQGPFSEFPGRIRGLARSLRRR